MSIDTPTRLTSDDLLTLPDGKSYELVDGELVELKMSQESSWIAGRIHRRLSEFGEDAGLGWAFPEGTGFQCFPHDVDRVRKPDASFIAKARQPDGPIKQGYGRIAPDLVVEVVSPNDLAWEVEAKVNDWLDAGVSVVWVVMPQSRRVTVHRADTDIQTLAAEAELTLPDLIPEFRCRVANFFPPTG